MKLLRSLVPSDESADFAGAPCALPQRRLPPASRPNSVRTGNAERPWPRAEMEEVLAALIVAGSASDAGRIVRELERGGYAVRCRRVETAEQMRDALDSHQWDVVLCASQVAGFDARGALAALQASGHELPFILLADTTEVELARELMRVGAHDYVSTDRLRRLAPAVEREVREARARRERARADAALQRSERLHRAVLQTAMDGFWIVDAQGRFVDVNEVYCGLIGYSREQLLQLGIADVEALETPEQTARRIRQIVATGQQHFETRHRRSDGKLIDLEVSAVFEPFPQEDRLIVFLRDISERKRQERLLQQSEARFRGLVEESLNGVYLVSTETDRFLYVNPRLEQLLGFGAGEMVGMRGQDLIVAEDQPLLRAHRERMLAGAEASSCNLRARRKDGSIVEIELRACICQLEDQPTIMGMVHDNSEKRRAREELERHVAQIEAAFLSTIEVAMNLAEMHDPYTAGHEQRVGALAMALGAELGLDAQRQQGLRIAGQLHDIGKMVIPSEILLKPGRLSAIEYEMVRTHPQASHDVLRHVRFPWPVAEVALQHHERIDGSGYPQGLRGEAIALEARIVAVADVVEAMSSHRPYRAALGIDRALAEIERGRGSAYDASVVDACLKLFRVNGYVIPDAR